MEVYIVYLLKYNGTKLIDIFEVKNIEQLNITLTNNKFLAIKIYKLPKLLFFLKPLFMPKITNVQVIGILNDLIIMLKAGITLDQSLKDLIEDTENNHIKKLLSRILSDVSSGNKLSVACKPFEKYFTSTIINLMKIGEETGQLTITLTNGADFLHKNHELQKNTKKALFTPILSIGLMFVAVGAWMTFVVPGLVDFFEDLDTPLPVLTKVLISISDFLGNYLIYIIFSIFIFIIIFKFTYKKILNFRIIVLKILLKIPFLSTIIKYYNIAFIAQYLQLSINSGMTLYDSLITLKDSLSNEIYKMDIKNLVNAVENGIPISTMTKNNQLYTNFVTRLLLIGETTGSMENELKMISSVYFKKVDDLSTTIPKVVQPIILLVGGGIMTVILLGLMGPIYDLIATM